MFTLLYVTHGEKTFTKEKPSWLIASSISLVNALISLEKPCATKVAPDDKANSSGATFFSILPLGVDLVTKPTADEGDV